MDASLSSEAKRLDLLRSLNLLHTEQEKVFDDITSLAAHVMAAPIALVSLVDENFQWFKSKVGLQCQQTGRDVSFCDHAIRQDDLSKPFVVPDATQDPRFAANELVTGPMQVRMYAGVPLVIDDGLALGALCVIDKVPRVPTEDQLSALQTLARSVMTLIESRRAAELLRISEERNRLIVEAAIDAVVTIDAARRIVSCNAKARTMFDLSSPDQRKLDELVSTDNDPDLVAMLLGDAAAQPPQMHIELTLMDWQGNDFAAELSLVSTPMHSTPLRTAFIRDVSVQRRAEVERREAETRDVVIFALARLAESRDNDTGTHIERVQHYCQALAEELRHTRAFPDLLDEEFVRLMHTTSPLHDIGKVGIPDAILLKPGKLDSAEMAVMQTHARIGADTLEAAVRRFPNVRFLRMARNIAATHHERYDGTGYPNGLFGEQIPLCGRIVALADVYDALTTRRVYKAAMPHATAVAIITKESGRHFDPAVVDAFLSIEHQFAAISGQRAAPISAAA